MAKVPKCDNCGVLEKAGVEIERTSQYTGVSGNNGLSITIPIPEEWRYKDLCGDCIAEIIRARFAELCGLLSPYQPRRVSGFIQNALPANEEQLLESPLSDTERKALAVLGRRLLKA